MQELIDTAQEILVNTSPYSQLALATTVYAVGGYFADDFETENNEVGKYDDLDIREEMDWLDETENNYQNVDNLLKDE